jgi:hypothetical protein
MTTTTLVAGYRFALTCPNDGTPTTHQADGHSDGWTTRAITHCPTCHRSFLITVELAPLATKGPQT